MALHLIQYSAEVENSSKRSKIDCSQIVARLIRFWTEFGVDDDEELDEDEDEVVVYALLVEKLLVRCFCIDDGGRFEVNVGLVKLPTGTR